MHTSCATLVLVYWLASFLYIIIILRRYNIILYTYLIITLLVHIYIYIYFILYFIYLFIHYSFFFNPSSLT